ncbi:MAG: DUF1425 domain-containing protein [Planctomycetota bacterium]|nr:DUF1425 domain-containing protein [Planctomycetota bacterium]
MRRYITLTASWVLASVLFGCTTEPAHVVQEDSPYLSQGRLQFEDSKVKYVLQVARIDTQRVGSGLLKVIATFRNTTKENVWIDARTTFLDAQGHMLEQTNWEPIMLDARTVTEYTCTSMSTKAADYQVIVREPKKHSTRG